MTLNRSYSAFSHSGTTTMCPNDVSTPLDLFPGPSSRRGPIFRAIPFRHPRRHPCSAWPITHQVHPLCAAQAAACQVQPLGPCSHRRDTTMALPNPVRRPHGRPTRQMMCMRIRHVLWPICRRPRSPSDTSAMSSRHGPTCPDVSLRRVL